MLKLFKFQHQKVDTADLDHLLHGSSVTKLEKAIADYCGAKYAVSLSSATNAIFLSLVDFKTTLSIPSCLPPVVVNAIVASGNDYTFNDNVDWIGDSYTLHDFGDFKIVDSAQKLERLQFSKQCNDSDLLLFSFYPTKPLGGVDGGMVVSNDRNKIEHIRTLSLNGQTNHLNNWQRSHRYFGHKMYLNTLQASIIYQNFEYYEEKIKKMRNVLSLYNEIFGTSQQSEHLYRLNVCKRDYIVKTLENSGIATGIHYRALHEQDFYKYKGPKLERSKFTADHTLSLPFHTDVNIKDIKRIYSLIKTYVVQS